MEQYYQPYDKGPSEEEDNQLTWKQALLVFICYLIIIAIVCAFVERPKPTEATNVKTEQLQIHHAGE